MNNRHLAQLRFLPCQTSTLLPFVHDSSIHRRPIHPGQLSVEPTSEPVGIQSQIAQ